MLTRYIAALPAGLRGATGEQVLSSTEPEGLTTTLTAEDRRPRRGPEATQRRGHDDGNYDDDDDPLAAFH